VAAGLDQAVATTKSALLSSGVADASAAAVALADRTVEASGVVGLTRKAVAAVGRAVDATAAAAERTGAADLSYRVSEASAAALAPAVAISQRAYGATVDATVAAADATLSGTLKAVAITGRAAEVLPQAVDIMGCVRPLARGSEARAYPLQRPKPGFGRERSFAQTLPELLLRALRLRSPLRAPARRIKEELKELTQDSNERMLAALYPVRSPLLFKHPKRKARLLAPSALGSRAPRLASQGWSGDTSGCALLLCAIESSWTAVAARQAPQQASAAYADAAAARVAAAASTRRDAWRPLELARLPELTVGMQEAGAMAGRLLSRCEALSAAMDAAEAAAWAAPLAAREASAVRAAAAAESRHASDLALLRAEGEKRRRWAASRAAMEAAARVAPGVLPRRLRVGPAAHGRALAHVQVDLEEATASLRSFLDAPAAEARDGDARAPRRRHKERGAEGERRTSDGSERRRRHRAKSGKELDYLDYKGAHCYAPLLLVKPCLNPNKQATKTRCRWRYSGAMTPPISCRMPRRRTPSCTRMRCRARRRCRASRRTC